MLDTDSADHLAAIFNQFTVPMFAADRPSAQSEFKITCINQAHAEATGFQPEALRNVALRDLLPEGEAATVIGRYTECADGQKNIRYLETLTLPDGVQRWDTSIQHVPLADGGDRVIGTAFKVTGDQYAEGTRMTFDNIRFFSSLADMHLQNLVSMFETARDQGLFHNDSANRVSQLCSVCRSVQRSVEDIRETVRRAHPETAGIDSNAQAMLNDLGSSTLRALYDSAREVS